MKKKKQVIDLENERYGLFMTDNSFNLEIMYGRNFLETDNVQEVTIHKINIIETKSHNLYGQSKSKDKKFFPPVKIKAIVNVEESKQSYYGESQGGITRDDTGNIVFSVYLQELEEKKIEINRGDIVEYNFSGEKSRFYEVENANMITDTTKQSIGGFKPYYKKVIGVPVKSDIFNYNDGEKGI